MSIVVGTSLIAVCTSSVVTGCRLSSPGRRSFARCWPLFGHRSFPCSLSMPFIGRSLCRWPIVLPFSVCSFCRYSLVFPHLGPVHTALTHRHSPVQSSTSLLSPIVGHFRLGRSPGWLSNGRCPYLDQSIRFAAASRSEPLSAVPVAKSQLFACARPVDRSLICNIVWHFNHIW